MWRSIRDNSEFENYKRVGWRTYTSQNSYFEMELRISKISGTRMYNVIIFCNLKNKEDDIESKLRVLQQEYNSIITCACYAYGVTLISSSDENIDQIIQKIIKILRDNKIDNRCSYCVDKKDVYATYHNYKGNVYCSCDECAAKINEQLDIDHEEQYAKRRQKWILTMVIQAISMVIALIVLFFVTRITINFQWVMSILLIIPIIMPWVISKVTDDGDMIMTTAGIWCAWIVVLIICANSFVKEQYDAKKPHYEIRIVEAEAEYKKASGFDYSNISSGYESLNQYMEYQTKLTKAENKVKGAHNNLNKLITQYKNYNLVLELMHAGTAMFTMLMESFYTATKAGESHENEYLLGDVFDAQMDNYRG